MARIRIAIILVFVCLCTAGWPQADVKSELPVAKPEVVFSLIDSTQKVTAWRDLRVQFSAREGGVPAGVGLTSLSLSVPKALVVTSDRFSGADDHSTLVLLAGKAFELRTPGEQRDFAPIELRAKYFREMKGELWSILTYRPQKEVFVATLSYIDLSDPDLTRTATSRLEIPVEPNPIGIYFGGFVGAILVAILRTLKSATATRHSRLPTNQWILEHLGNFALVGIRGGVVAAIAVLLVQMTSDFNLPISVGVQDFYGGLVLGFFGDKIAEQILTRIGDGAENTGVEVDQPKANAAAGGQ